MVKNRRWLRKQKKQEPNVRLGFSTNKPPPPRSVVTDGHKNCPFCASRSTSRRRRNRKQSRNKHTRRATPSRPRVDIDPFEEEDDGDGDGDGDVDRRRSTDHRTAAATSRPRRDLCPSPVHKKNRHPPLTCPSLFLLLYSGAWCVFISFIFQWRFLHNALIISNPRGCHVS